MNEWIRDRGIRGRVTFSIDDVRNAFPEMAETTLATAIQRLGYLLEFVLEENEKADMLYELLTGNKKNLKLVQMRNDETVRSLVSLFHSIQDKAEA